MQRNLLKSSKIGNPVSENSIHRELSFQEGVSSRTFVNIGSLLRCYGVSGNLERSMPIVGAAFLGSVILVVE